MGATLCLHSDRYACTIIEVRKNANGEPIAVVIQRDKAKRIDGNGMSECQKYEYSPNPYALKRTFTLRKNGRWVEQGSKMNGTSISIGVRKEYYDFSF